MISRWFRFVCFPSKANEACFVYTFFIPCQSIDWREKKKCCLCEQRQFFVKSFVVNVKKMNPCVLKSNLRGGKHVLFVCYHDIWINWLTSKAFPGFAPFSSSLFPSHMIDPFRFALDVASISDIDDILIKFSFWLCAHCSLGKLILGIFPSQNKLEQWTPFRMELSMNFSFKLFFFVFNNCVCRKLPKP